MVESDFGLCGACWRDTSFIGGTICDSCGVPLSGEQEEDALHCDDCLVIARPWRKGRAALAYNDTGRKLVLALKHGDRADIARPAAVWLVAAGRDILDADTLLVPVPLHWRRLLKRRYNQSALLTHALERKTGIETCPDLLMRPVATRSLEGLGREQRFQMLQDAIRVHPKRETLIKNRKIVLVDDVMTSGATFAAATQACQRAGASDVCVLALARVAKDA
jgi:ComF family protein